MRLPFFIFILLGFGLVPKLSAQDCNLVLKGTVMDFHDKSPLVGATIVELASGNATVSDIDGNYRLTGLCPGEYEFELSHSECRTTLYRISLNSDKTVDFSLEHHIEELEQVDVVGLSCLSGAHNYLFPEVIKELRKKEMDNVLVIGGGNIPAEDIPFLVQNGVSAIFGPGIPIKEIASYIRSHINEGAYETSD